MRVRVPASSANIGPGFDCFGIAWQLYNQIDFDFCDEGIKISGCPEKYQNPENLAYLGYKAVLDAAGLKDRGVKIDFVSTNIPVSRGLGSSSSLIVGGVMAANEMYSLNMSREQLLVFAAEIEGHPDNIAPTMLGGLTASIMDCGKVITVSFPISKIFNFTALIPDFELSTELSRSVLPETYSRADAIFNVSHAALMLNALEHGDTELITNAIIDRIHQPYRTHLIDGYKEVGKLSEECGADGMFISGAGSTLLCISHNEGFKENMRKKMAEYFPLWKIVSLIPDYNGASII